MANPLKRSDPLNTISNLVDANFTSIKDGKIFNRDIPDIQEMLDQVEGILGKKGKDAIDSALNQGKSLLGDIGADGFDILSNISNLSRGDTASLTDKVFRGHEDLIKTFNQLESGDISKILGGVTGGGNETFTLDGMTKYLPDGFADGSSLKAVSKMVDDFTGGNFKPTISNTDGLSGLLKGITEKADSLGLDNVFSTLSNHIGDKSALLEAGKTLFSKFSGNGKSSSALDILNSSVGSDVLSSLGSGSIGTFFKTFKSPELGNFGSQNDFLKKASDVLSSVIPDWKSAITTTISNPYDASSITWNSSRSRGSDLSQLMNETVRNIVPRIDTPDEATILNVDQLATTFFSTPQSKIVSKTLPTYIPLKGTH